MVLTKEELLSALRGEVRLLLHLISKITPDQLEYRPSPGQRSLLELLRYLTIFGPTHMRGTLADSFSFDGWGKTWTEQEALAEQRDLEAVRESIAGQPALFSELLSNCTDADLRAEISMFGSQASRGSLMVNLVLCHYSAYRMQLFLYLKAAGHPELNTMNLWVGIDMSMERPA